MNQPWRHFLCFGNLLTCCRSPERFSWQGIQPCGSSQFPASPSISAGWGPHLDQTGWPSVDDKRLINIKTTNTRMSVHYSQRTATLRAQFLLDYVIFQHQQCIERWPPANCGPHSTQLLFWWWSVSGRYVAQLNSAGKHNSPLSSPHTYSKDPTAESS